MPTKVITTKFFTFSQNNSGGSFRVPAMYVIVEARNAEEANRIAEDRGLYFNGCDSGNDCSCCGDRWSSQWSDKDGDEVPSIYDSPLNEKSPDDTRKRWLNEAAIPYAIVYHLDGTEERHG